MTFHSFEWRIQELSAHRRAQNLKEVIRDTVDDTFQAIIES